MAERMARRDDGRNTWYVVRAMTGRARTSGPEDATKPGSRTIDDDAPARVRQLVIVASPSSASTRAASLGEGELVLGRSPSGSRVLEIADDELSRSHCVVAREPETDGYVLTDLGSRNGTHVDGARVTRAPLRAGSVIRAGRTLLVFTDTEVGASDSLVPETPGLLGGSLRMQRLRGEIARVASTGLSVLVLGESGTGKERVAEALHAASGRGGPLVAVNCASIPEALADSQLFGHVAGAFTGAQTRNDGLFVAAEGGTLFLDEVAELPASVQAKLLRALATGQVRAVGRTDDRKVDVRIVAATHRDVAAQIEAGGFRGDLFARLSGWTLRVPALRDRREDVLRLASAFVPKDAGVQLTTAAAEALLLYSWPYNVRELQQVLQAAAVRARDEGRLRPGHLPPEVAAVLGPRAAAKSSSRPPLAVLVPADQVPDAAALRTVFESLDGNLARVADYFGKDRRQIYRWLELAGLDLRTLRQPGDESRFTSDDPEP